jgi:hypothetical protein
MLKKKGFAMNDKILHSDGDFFAIPRVAQQLIAVTCKKGNLNPALGSHAGFIFFRPGWTTGNVWLEEHSGLAAWRRSWCGGGGGAVVRG